MFAPAKLEDGQTVRIGPQHVRYVRRRAPEAVPGLDKSHSCAHFVTAFLASATYRDLVAGLNGWSRSPGEDSRGGPEGDGSGAN